MDPVYIAQVYVPGYLPECEPTWHDTAREAWEYLASERRGDEDQDESASEYSETVDHLDHLASGDGESVMGEDRWPNPVDRDGAGYLHAGTPGSDSPHDLGLIYRVSAVRHADYPHEPGYLYDCRACEARCWCAESPDSAECVYGGEHV